VALNKGSEQAEKASVATETLLWGCPIRNFKATLPFNTMKRSCQMKTIIRIADQWIMVLTGHIAII
jgi:hypothetical protein